MSNDVRLVMGLAVLVSAVVGAGAQGSDAAPFDCLQDSGDVDSWPAEKRQWCYDHIRTMSDKDDGKMEEAKRSWQKRLAHLRSGGVTVQSVAGTVATLPRCKDGSAVVLADMNDCPKAAGKDDAQARLPSCEAASPGELCEGRGPEDCGTDNGADNCVTDFGYYVQRRDIYRKVTTQTTTTTMTTTKTTTTTTATKTTTTATTTTATNTATTATKTTTTATTTTVTTPNCELDARGEWMTAWAQSRKDTCCEYKHTACPDDYFDTTTATTTTTSVTSTTVTSSTTTFTTTTSSITTTMHFDCTVGLDRWEHAWSDYKKEWCKMQAIIAQESVNLTSDDGRHHQFSLESCPAAGRYATDKLQHASNENPYKLQSASGGIMTYHLNGELALTHITYMVVSDDMVTLEGTTRYATHGIERFKLPHGSEATAKQLEELDKKRLKVDPVFSYATPSGKLILRLGWIGDVGERLRRMEFYAFKTQQPSTHPVHSFWHEGNQDHTYHFGEAWEGEEKEQAAFFAYPLETSAAEGLQCAETVYDFWDRNRWQHTFHTGAAREGERRNQRQFYALPPTEPLPALEPVSLGALEGVAFARARRGLAIAGCAALLALVAAAAGLMASRWQAHRYRELRRIECLDSDLPSAAALVASGV